MDTVTSPEQTLVLFTQKIEELLSQKTEEFLSKQEELNTKLIAQLNGKILQLEQNQAEEMRNFLEKLAETLNSKKSNSLETTLKELTTALEAVVLQVGEQKTSQETLTETIREFLNTETVSTRQQLTEMMNTL
ncbi:hypothetical protein [Nostoc sp.]